MSTSKDRKFVMKPQPKTRRGMKQTAAAKMKSIKKDSLRSQSDESRKSEEDEEIVALIEERKKIKKNDNERLKEVSRKIQKCIRSISEEKDTYLQKMKKAKFAHQERNCQCPPENI